MQDLPNEYCELSSDELHARIAERKRELGARLCILGHHYQRDEVIRYADHRGDSLKLSQIASRQREAKYIVFCGVHFMAESADILAGEDQIVCLPNLRAGCAMADQADEDAVATALKELSALAGEGETVMPVSYVNSTAAVKAVTGRAGGACCTSSNVRNVFDWALRAGGATKILAVPDQHLARNTAVALGYTENDCVLYDPALPNGGLDAKQVKAATFILWKGFCYVHQVFRPEHIHAARAATPGIKVIVHPECPREVVALADESGSTSRIIKEIDEAPAGSAWAVATEANLVHRLAKQYPDKTIHLLGETAPANCVQMARIDLPHLLWCLDAIAADAPVNVIRVPKDIAADAKLALQRMIETQSG
ncbi:MAG: quinolinate synthase NadA [Phycisphaerae bacterium]|nr:quinolinate synthase NadA [Phycisphaerae bacterium]